jgi:hypothetical protein
MDLAFVILGVIVIFVLYYFLNSDGSTLLSNKLDLGIKQPDIPVATLGTTATATRYSYEMWMYVYQFPGTSTYIISRRAKDATDFVPAVTAVTGSVDDPNTAANEFVAAKAGADAVPANIFQNIGIKIDGAAPKLSVEYSSNKAKKEHLITDNLPLQTWVHLIVSIDNTFVDVYMNGKLIKSFQDNTIDAPSDTSNIEYGQINCYLAKLTRTTTATDPQTAWDLYSAGNGENPLAKYLASFGLSVTLQKNNQDYSKITVF